MELFHKVATFSFSATDAPVDYYNSLSTVGHIYDNTFGESHKIIFNAHDFPDSWIIMTSLAEGMCGI